MMYLRSKVQLDCYPSFLVTLALKKHLQLGSHFGLSSSRRFSLQSSSSLVPTLDYFHVQLQFFSRLQHGNQHLRMLNVHTSVGQVSKMKWELVRSSSQFSRKHLSDITYDDIQVDIRHRRSHWDENRHQRPCLFI